VPAERQRGVVLLVTLLAVALLSMAVMEFTYASQVRYRRAARWLAARQAALIADSGLDLASEILEQSDELYRLLYGRTKTADGLDEFWAQLCAPATPDTCPSELPPLCVIDTGIGHLALRITDESGLYNLNRAAAAGSPGRERERAVLERIFQAAGVDRAIVGLLVDWVDADDRPYPYGPGAEAAHYAGLQLLYGPPNRPARTFRELALIDGIGRTELARLRRLATVLDPAAAPTVNVNTAPLELLAALDPAIEPLLPTIAEERCRKPFSSLEDLRRRVPDWPRWLGTRWIGFRALVFRVRATGSVADVYRSVEALLRRTDRGMRIEFYLIRPGVNIPGVETAQPASLSDIQTFAGTSEEGRP